MTDLPATMAELLDDEHGVDLGVITATDALDVADRLRSIADVLAPADSSGAARLRDAAEHVERCGGII